LGELNTQNLTVSPTYEDNGQINFLDFLLVRREPKIDIDVHHKPITSGNDYLVRRFKINF
jgi:hypothetical protein